MSAISSRTPSPTALSSGAAAAVALALCVCPVPALSLPDAEFYEYVGIGMFSSEGVDPNAPETVSLTVLPEDWFDRGGGTGQAWTSAVQPVSTGLSLSLIGGSDPSGIGGTSTTLVRYYFSLVRENPEAPEYAELLLTASVSVTVDESDESIGRTFADITVARSYSHRVTNCDANGCYNGNFGREWHDEPIIGSFAVGDVGTIDLYMSSHGDGSGVDYTFAGSAFIDPMLSVAGPWADAYRIEYSPQIIAVAEPATWSLLAAGIPLALLVGSRRLRRT